MVRRVGIAVLVAAAACSESGDGDRDPQAAPEQYPQLGQIETGRAELVVDGEPFVAGMAVGARTPTGPGDFQVLFTFGYVLEVSMLEAVPGRYTVEDGTLEARWTQITAGSATADADCGRGVVTIDGVGQHGSLQTPLVWGTAAFEMCDDEGTIVREVSGLFTVTILG